MQPVLQDDTLGMLPPATPLMQPATPLMQPGTPMMQPGTPMMQPATPLMTHEPMIPASPLMQPQTPLMQPATPHMQAPPTPQMHSPQDPPTPFMAPPTPLMAPPTPHMAPATPHMTPGTPLMQPATPLMQPGTPLMAPGTPLRYDEHQDHLGPASVFSVQAPPTPLPLEDIPAHEVSSFLQDHEAPSTHETEEHHQQQPNQTPLHIPDGLDNLPAMENMGYDHQTGHMQMANMGYDEHLPAQTPGGAMSERVSTPWHEDYDFPASVGHIGEEQLVDETDEQFEERVLNKRACQMFSVVKSKFHRSDHLFLSEMTIRNTRKQVRIFLFMYIYDRCLSNTTNNNSL